MSDVKLNFENSTITEKMIMEYKSEVAKIHKQMDKLANNEKEFLGWLELPTNYDKKEFARIKKAAKKIKNDTDVLIVIGIGGSYLGARAVIESLTNTFYNMMSDEKRKTPRIMYAGNNLSPNYLNDLLEFIEDKDISINVISKSGTTTEPAIAFRIFREVLETKYGVEEARKRIYVTTDKKKGALKGLADEEEYETFVIPDNVGGRFSVLTAVGLLPIAVAGINIDNIMAGAKIGAEIYNNDNLKKNDCYKYAVIRKIMYQNEKNIELLASYEPKLVYFSEWWKQLFGESEGKNHKGIFPSSVVYTTDLHSLGQYVQEGRRNLFETVINIENPNSDIVIGYDDENLDELNYIAGKKLSYVNKKALEATVLAHVDGDVPNIIFNIDYLDEITIGQMIYFFEKACAISGMLLEVNPFDQPGVEKYKMNMYDLLGKNI